jgi:Cu/Ag efflux protein CusF
MRTMSALALSIALALAVVASMRGQTPNVVTSEETITARVDRIEKTPRLVTLKTADNQFKTIHVDPTLTVFDQLRVGDTVTVRYVESTVVALKPQAALSPPRDTTEEARRAGKTDVVSQQKAVVTIEGIDPGRQFVTFRWENGSRMVRPVYDKRLLEGLRAGDRVEVTMTRERAISITRR